MTKGVALNKITKYGLYASASLFLIFLGIIGIVIILPAILDIMFAAEKAESLSAPALAVLPVVAMLVFLLIPIPGYLGMAYGIFSSKKDIAKKALFGLGLAFSFGLSFGIYLLSGMFGGTLVICSFPFMLLIWAMTFACSKYL